MTNAPTHVTGNGAELEWHYDVPPRTDAKLHLLTVGRIAVHGNWTGKYGQHFIAWAPMPKRNKPLEDQLIASGIIPN